MFLGWSENRETKQRKTKTKSERGCLNNAVARQGNRALMNEATAATESSSLKLRKSLRT
jgi:hypothetical protein